MNMSLLQKAMGDAKVGLSGISSSAKTRVSDARYDARIRVHNILGYLYRKNHGKSAVVYNYDEKRYITPKVNETDLAVQLDNRFAILQEQEAAIIELEEAQENKEAFPTADNQEIVAKAAAKLRDKNKAVIEAIEAHEHIPIGAGDIPPTGDSVDYCGATETTACGTGDYDLKAPERPMESMRLRIDRKAVNQTLIKKRWFKAYSKLLNHIRIKYFMRSRDTTTIHNMVSDARVWLIKNGHTCDTDLDYQILSASVMAAFVVSEEELEFRKLLKDSSVQDGVKHLNATMSGDLGYSWKPLLQRLGEVKNPLLTKVSLPSKPLV